VAYDLSPFGTPAAGRSSRWVAGGTTVFFHVALAVFFLLNPDARRSSEQWVEMVVQKTEPPPPPPPPEEPPPPEPEPEKPKPKPVAFKDIPKTPPPDVPPQEAPPTEAPPPTRAVRRVQGLSASSFATGSGTGVSVRAGSGVDMAAGKETATLADATAPRSYASVTRPPKPKSRPNMDVPDEAKKANVEGVIKVLLTIGTDGRVKAVKVLSDLGFGTGELCAAAWKKATFVPGEQDGQPVEVTGYPEKCTVSIVE
jgi:periplasmic protein TonB